MMKRIDPSLSIDLQEYLDLTGYDSVEWIESHSTEPELPGTGPQSAEGLGDGEPIMAAERNVTHSVGQGSEPFLGTGSLKAELLFIGEASDSIAQPQQGPDLAEELLAKMIVAMGYQKDEVYVLSFAKEASTATWAEIRAQIGSIGPRAIVALGALAAQTLLENETSITELRGKMWEAKVGNLNVSLFPTFHPAYLLRKATHKKDVWDDLQKVVAFLKT